jgi:CDP-glucose 4,6-dehydratase
MGTAHVLDSLRYVDSVRVAVMITTDKVYENFERHSGYREDEALGGYDPYSSSKAGAELVIAAMRRSFLADRGIAGGQCARRKRDRRRRLGGRPGLYRMP